MSLYFDIYEVVKCIPPGKVTSYGRIAKVVNCGARQVGYAMAATPGGQDIPWHRVVNSKGEISARKEGDSDQRQRRKLMDEGIVFDRHGRIDFDQYGWEGIDTFVSLEDWPDDWPHPDHWQKDQA